MDGPINLNNEFKEFIQLLNANHVRYLVVGGYAVTLHGHPRYTKDIDIWLELAEENTHNVIRALEEFGFGSLGLCAEDFMEPEQIIQLGYPPNRIDLLTSLKGMNFQECFQNRLDVVISGVSIHFIDLMRLKKSKQLAGQELIIQKGAVLNNFDSFSFTVNGRLTWGQ